MRLASFSEGSDSAVGTCVTPLPSRGSDWLRRSSGHRVQVEPESRSEQLLSHLSSLVAPSIPLASSRLKALVLCAPRSLSLDAVDVTSGATTEINQLPPRRTQMMLLFIRVISTTAPG